MQYHSGNIPRLEYFHHQFDKVSARITDVERRLNDINQKLENFRNILQKLEFNDEGDFSSMNKEIKEIKSLLLKSQIYHERVRKFRLPL